MAGQRNHHSSKIHRLQVIIVPEENGEKGFAFMAHRWQLVACLAGVVMLIIAASVGAIAYTPLGRLIPVSGAELSQRYGPELVTLQHRVIGLSEEMLVLRDYNRKLRYALGDVADIDSILTGVAGQIAVAPDVPFDASDSTNGNLQATVRADANDVRNEKHRSIVSKEVKNGERTDAESEVTNGERADGESGGTNGGRSESNVTSVQGVQHSVAFRASFPISAPVEGYITRTFQTEKLHFGIDYAGKRGTIVTAAADGYIIFSNWTHEGGNIIILSHGGGYVTIYQHNQSLLKQQGDFVKRGTPIALLGDSGTTSYGPHLHFELWKDGQAQNPGEYMIASGK